MIDKLEINTLLEYARQFRIAIMKTNKAYLPVTFNNFPRGACGDTSWLLGRYLRDKGIKNVEYVCGVKCWLVNEEYKHQSHAWLEVGRIIIDITSDQFDDVDEEIVVTEDRTWHNQFNEERRGAADYNAYDSPANKSLDKAYKSICSNIID